MISLTLYQKKNSGKKSIPSLLLMMRAGYDLYEIVKKFDYCKLLRLQDQDTMEETQIAFSIQAKLNNENIILVNLSKPKNNSKKLLFLLNSIGLKVVKFNNSILKLSKILILTF